MTILLPEIATTDRYDLVIIGGRAGGLSVAISSRQWGLERVRVVEPSSEIAFAELVAENQLDIGYGEHALGIDVRGDDLVVTTNVHSYTTVGCLVTLREPDTDWVPPIAVPASDRVLIDKLPEHPHDKDILVIGYTDHAVELVAAAATAGARVVMAAGGMDPAQLSPAGETILWRLERDRRATLLYWAVPEQIGLLDVHPIAYFGDRRTPDLEFDYVVFASQRRRVDPQKVGVSAAALATGKVWFLGEPRPDDKAPTAPGWEVGFRIAGACFPDLAVEPPKSSVQRRARHAGVIEELRERHYNATITQFERTHPNLWVLRVQPDHGNTSHVPGQYATLGLGFWEDRVDTDIDPDLDDRWWKLIRRSYSISNPIFDGHGYLAAREHSEEIEFYITLTRTSDDKVPALTPRLALKGQGDRIYLGPTVTGRYTLNAVTDPGSTVVFLATGTGEAPHNAMAVELLRKGHFGPIVSAVSVRRWADLAYLDKQRQLEARYHNYRYLPVATREPDVPKRYIQDLITERVFDTQLGIDLDPATTHVFLCGNPQMIGLPEEHGGIERFPEPVGVIELLTKRGFTLDRRRAPGNIHYEEYW